MFIVFQIILIILEFTPLEFETYDTKLSIALQKY